MDTSVVDAVRRFTAALQDIRGRLFADLAPVADVEGLLAAVRSSRELPRVGVTSSGIEYTVHGAGCRMVAPDGGEDIVAACTYLCGEGQLREVVAGRWFALPDAFPGQA